MTQRKQLTLTANGNGAQPYLGAALLEDSRCPLDQGETVTGLVIDGVGILLTDAPTATRLEREGLHDGL